MATTPFALVDETLQDLAVRLFGGPLGAPTGLGLLDVGAPAPDNGKTADLVEVCGEVGSGKTALLIALAASALARTEEGEGEGGGDGDERGQSGDAQPLRAANRVLWYDCDCKLRVPDFVAAVMTALAAKECARKGGGGGGGGSLARRTRACLLRVDVVRPRDVPELAAALADASAGRPAAGSARGGQARGRPALVVADGLGTLLWAHTRAPLPATLFPSPAALFSPAPTTVAQADAVASALAALSRKYRCRVLWSRQLLFRLAELPSEVKQQQQLAGAEAEAEEEAGPASLQAAMALAQGRAVDLLVRAAPMLSGARAALRSAVEGSPFLVEFAVPPPPTSTASSEGARGGGAGQRRPAAAAAGAGMPGWPSSWRPSSFAGAVAALQDTVPSSLRGVTRSLVVVTRVVGVGGGGAGFAPSALVRRGSERGEVCAQVQHYLLRFCTSGAAAGRSEGGEGAPFAGVSECGMVAAVGR